MYLNSIKKPDYKFITWLIFLHFPSLNPLRKKGSSRGNCKDLNDSSSSRMIVVVVVVVKSSL